MTACGADYILVFPQKFSDGKYILYQVPDQPVIPQIEIHKVIPEPLPEE